MAKISNMASAAREHMSICRAKVEEKASPIFIFLYMIQNLYPVSSFFLRILFSERREWIDWTLLENWQVEKATARTHDEKKIAKERRKAKEARAKMELHQAKARHAAEKSSAKWTYHLPTVGADHHHHLHLHLHQSPRTVGGYANQPVGASVPAYPLGGHPPGI